MAKARDELTGQLGRSPTVQELAEAVEAPFEEVAGAIQSVGARRTRSLDEPTGEDMTLADSIGGPIPSSSARRCASCSTTRWSVLSERDREVLRLRFEEDLTQTEISAHRRLPDAGLAHIRQSLVALRMDIESSNRQRRISAG